MQVLLWVLGVLVVIVCLLWLGLQVQPRTFAAARAGRRNHKRAAARRTSAPLERYLRAVYGEELPIVETSVITGRGRIRPSAPGTGRPVFDSSTKRKQLPPLC